MKARSALLRSPAVISFRFLGTALALSAIVGTLVHAQLTDEEKKKRDAQSKAREEMRGDDGRFGYENLINRTNSDLASGLGNLSSRTLTMIERITTAMADLDSIRSS